MRQALSFMVIKLAKWSPIRLTPLELQVLPKFGIDRRDTMSV
jgi:hypothetical protein